MAEALPVGMPNPDLHSIPTGVPNRGPQLNAVYIGMVVPATVIVAIRLGWKYHLPKGLGLDDLSIFLAIVSTLCARRCWALVDEMLVCGLDTHRPWSCQYVDIR